MVPQALRTAIEHRRSGNLQAAERICRQILEEDPHQALALNLLGMIAQQSGRRDRAIEYLHRAVVSNPLDPTFPYNLGTVHYELGALDEAVTCYRQALRLAPDFTEALGNLGNALRRRGDYDEALSISQHLLHLKPDSAEAHNNLGTVLYKLRRLDEALACFEQSLRLKPDHAQAHYNRALVWLLTGDLARGFEEYEWRWRRRGYALPPFRQPAWDGSPLAGKAILLYAEQGLGDTFQFIRYARHVQEQGGAVLVACHRPLLPLLSRCKNVAHFAPLDAHPLDFTVQAPLMSLPRLLGTLLAKVPADVPYLFPDPELAAQWRTELSKLEGLKVGIAWQGDPRNEYDRQRSAGLAHFEELARLAGVRLISLQKGAGVEQLPALAERVPVTDLGSRLDERSGAFMDTAACMRSLDLVITVDSAIAHLAGGLGVPVWVALPYSPDWRWLLDREDSPWYPTMRLFRQTAAGDWSGVFQRIAAELKKLVR